MRHPTSHKLAFYAMLFILGQCKTHSHNSECRFTFRFFNITFTHVWILLSELCHLTCIPPANPPASNATLISIVDPYVLGPILTLQLFWDDVKLALTIQNVDLPQSSQQNIHTCLSLTPGALQTNMHSARLLANNAIIKLTVNLPFASEHFNIYTYPKEPHGSKYFTKKKNRRVL